MITDTVIVRYLGMQDYSSCWQAMQQFTNQRHENSLDEIWVLEHPPVFTQGQNGKAEHILDPGNIPVIKVDRGGQVTYHGPGQLVVYTLIDIKRKKLNVRELVTILENSVIALLQSYQINATTQCKAPGVYVENTKICSVGLRIRKGCAYHGLALNVGIDLAPFSRINPCGFPQLKMTQVSEFKPTVDIIEIASQLVEYLIRNLGYTNTPIQAERSYETKQS